MASFEDSLGKIKKGFASALSGGNNSGAQDDEEGFFSESVRGVRPDCLARDLDSSLQSFPLCTCR